MASLDSRDSSEDRMDVMATPRGGLFGSGGRFEMGARSSRYDNYHAKQDQSSGKGGRGPRAQTILV
jgi:hypothetical protein